MNQYSPLYEISKLHENEGLELVGSEIPPSFEHETDQELAPLVCD